MVRGPCLPPPAQYSPLGTGCPTPRLPHGAEPPQQAPLCPRGAGAGSQPHTSSLRSQGGEGLGGSRAPWGAPARRRGPHGATTQLPRHRAGQDPLSPQTQRVLVPSPASSQQAASRPQPRTAGSRCPGHAPTASTGAVSAALRALPAAAQAAPGLLRLVLPLFLVLRPAAALGRSSPALAAGPAARCWDRPLQARTPPAAPSRTLPTTLRYKTSPPKPNPPAHVLGGAVPPDPHSSSRTPWMDTHTLLAPGLPAAPGALSCSSCPELPGAPSCHPAPCQPQPGSQLTPGPAPSCPQPPPDQASS